MGSKTPMRHASSSIFSVVGLRISNFPIFISGHRRPAGLPGGEAGWHLYCGLHPRWIPEGACFGGHTAAPHHLSGPPPPAIAVSEIGATVAVPIVSAAAASAIASSVFMVRSL